MMGYFWKKIERRTCLDNRDLKMSLTLGIGVGLFYLAFLPPGIYSMDGNSMLAVAESLVRKHSFTVPPISGMLGRDGQYYSMWYPLLSILAVPFVAIGLVLGQLFSLPTHYVAAVSALLLPALLTAATTSLVALLAIQLGSAGRGAFWAGLTFAVGTIASVYGRNFFAEPLLAFLTIGSFYCTLVGTKQRILSAGVLAGLAVLAKPTGVIVGPIVSLYLLARKQPVGTALVPLSGTCVGTILYSIYNYARFGNPLTFGQPWSFEITTLPEGFFGLLVSPGRGLLWYCPSVILSIVGLRKAVQSKTLESIAIIILFLAYLLLYSSWTSWDGGWSWGPRFLIPTLPGLLALTGLLEGRWRRALQILTVVGFMVSVPTLVSFYERYYAEAGEQGISRQDLLWSPLHSPLIHVWGASYRQISDALETDVIDVIREAGKPDKTIREGQMLRVVAVWWWMLPAVNIPVSVGILSALSLIGVGVWMLLRAYALTIPS